MTSSEFKENHSRLIQLSKSKETVFEYLSSVYNLKNQFESPRYTILNEILDRHIKAMFLISQNKSSTIYQLNRDIISYAEHHASITHPETTTVVANQLIYASKAKSRLLSLSCGTIPLSNNLFPRGLFIGNQPIAFVSRKYDSCTPLTCPPIKPEALQNILRTLEESNILAPEREIILSKLDSILTPMLDTDIFWRQISILNSALFKNMFSDNDSDNDHQYFMIPAEIIAKELIESHCKGETDLWLLRNLFQPKTLRLLYGTLNGVRGFWNTLNQSGTFFFWKVDKKGRLHRLNLNENNLVDDQNLNFCELSPIAILEAIEQQRLMPSISFAMLVTIFQFGIQNFGGLLQFDYLAEARSRLTKVEGLDLTLDESYILSKTPDSYYVNFEERTSTSGGLLRIANEIGQQELMELGNETIAESLEGCISFVRSLYHSTS